MFRSEKLIAPSRLDIALTIVVAAFSLIANHYSPAAGYVLAIATLLLILLQLFFSLSIWPTRGKEANPYLFGLYWGLMAGLVIPFLLQELFTGGLKGIWDLLIG